MTEHPAPADESPFRADVFALGFVGGVFAIVGFWFWRFDDWIGHYDVLTYFLPTYEYLGQRLREGQIPAWNPHLSSGTPAAGDPGGGWLYLPVMIGMVLGIGAVGIKIAVVIQLAIGTFGTWGFVRRLGGSPAAAAIAAIAWVSSAPATMLVGWFTVSGQMATWIPVILLAIESAWRASRWSARLGWSALGGIAIVQMFLSWPQGFLYGAILMAGWLGYRTFLDPGPGNPPVRQRLITAVGIGLGVLVTGGLTGLAGILPRLEFIAASSIPGGDYSNVVDGNYSEEFARWLTPIAAILTDHPYWRSMALSPVVLFLVAVALLARPWRRGIVFLVVAALVCFDLAVSPSLTRWAFDLVPPFARIHDHRPVVTMYLVPLLLIFLAGIGADALRRRQGGRAWTLPAAAGIAIAVVLIPRQEPNLTFDWWQLAVLAAAAIVVLLVRNRTIAMPIVAVLILVWPLATTIAETGRDPFRTRGSEYFVSRSEDLQLIIETMQRTSDPGTAAEILQNDPNTPFRYAWYIGTGWNGEYANAFAMRNHPGAIAALVNGRSIFLGLEDISGYNPVHLLHYVEYMEMLNGERQNYHWLDPFAHAFQGSQLLDMLNVRYVLLDATLPADRPYVATIASSFDEVWRNDTVIVYENPRAFPRAWIVHDVTTMSDADGLAALDTGSIDGRTTAYVDGEIPPVAPATGSETVTVAVHQPEHVVIDVTASSDGLVILGDAWEAGWTATVDGQTVDVLRTDTTFRGIPVTAGTHTIELRYEPMSLRIGMIGTGLGSLGAIGIWGWAIVDRRRRRESA